MTPDELYEDFEKGFSKRRFSAGLLVAFIDFLRDLKTPELGLANFEEFLGRFPRREKTASGNRANTLIVETGDGNKTSSLRPFYNAVEDFFRAEHKRFDYPSAAPHATQAWRDYENWLSALVAYTDAQLIELRGRVVQFVLDTLVSQEFDPASVEIEPPLFKLILESFPLKPTQIKTAPGEKGPPAAIERSGAPFQGIVFGFLRADNPHLQIEIDKVRTGSKRLQRVGDIDGWEGKRLAITAEVKQYVLDAGDAVNLESFANASGVRGALGIVAALDYEEDARPAFEALGLIPIDRQDMLRIVEIWDPLKQRTAVASFMYYATHVEKSATLATRISDFLAAADAEWQAKRIASIESGGEAATP